MSPLLSLSKEGGANAESGVQALEDPRRRHSGRRVSLLSFVSLSAYEVISLEWSKVLALVVVSSSKICNLDPVDPASITYPNPRVDS